jgi:uncharacterized protein YyaL (SSP411 family)
MAKTEAAKEPTPTETIQAAITAHREHELAWRADAKRPDVDEAFMTSLSGVVEARALLRSVRGITPERLAALDELVSAYHAQVVRRRRDYPGETNRFWMAWQGVLAAW